MATSSSIRLYSLAPLRPIPRHLTDRREGASPLSLLRLRSLRLRAVRPAPSRLARQPIGTSIWRPGQPAHGFTDSTPDINRQQIFLTGGNMGCFRRRISMGIGDGSGLALYRLGGPGL